MTDFDGGRLGLANVWEETQGDVQGTICFLSPDSKNDFDVRVGHGAEIDLGCQRYRVIAISEGEIRGSLTLERIDNNHSLHKAENGQFASFPSVLDWLIPLPFLFLPYIASEAVWRGLVAAASLVAYLFLLRPKWTGLQGFYAVGLLTIHFLVWVAIAGFACILG